MTAEFDSTPNPVEARNRLLAENAAELERQRVRNMLSRYPGQVHDSAIEVVVAGEGNRAAEELLRARENGEMNDQQSTKEAGVTLTVPARAWGDFVALLGQSPEYGDSIILVPGGEGQPGTVSLPRGSYWDEERVVEITIHGDDPDAYFSCNPLQIDRITSGAGELWVRPPSLDGAAAFVEQQYTAGR